MTSRVLPVTEIFHSIQGEGPGVGEPTVFVRFFGCPRRCQWCDSMHAVEGTAFRRMSFEEIFERARERPIFDNVCFTGGEPALYREHLSALIPEFFSEFNVRSIETATEDPGALTDLDLNRIVWSPKMPSSGEPKPSAPKISLELLSVLSTKIVIADEKDYTAALELLGEIRKSNPKTSPTEIFFQPEFSVGVEKLLEFWGRYGAADYRVRIIPQVHRLSGVR